MKENKLFTKILFPFWIYLPKTTNPPIIFTGDLLYTDASEIIVPILYNGKTSSLTFIVLEGKD